jgi:biopolymer transport protein ExbB
MNLTQRFLGLTLLGAGWVLWLLVLLSVASVAVMFERAVFLWSGRLTEELFAALKKHLAAGDLAAARAVVKGKNGIEARVADEGLAELERSPSAVGETMTGVRTRERLRLERNLSVLGTLGNNAPFIGLFGTVLGIIKAFHDLSQNQGGGATVVMAGISEALVATAVGLLVAIPAVVAFNFFQRRVRERLGRTDEIAHLILASAERVAGRDAGKA